MNRAILVRSAIIGGIAGLGLFSHLSGTNPVVPSFMFGLVVMMSLVELIDRK